ncbi:MAG: hypothetical protein H3C51_00470 [Rubellimicrobium sp.]|nr:hypothetical protein [Rubellimicrobium sp.]
MIDRRAFVIGAPLVLAGCTGKAVWAPEVAVARARFVAPGPPLVTLYTCLNNDTRNGAHTGLLINADQRVLFDPAGSFTSPGLVERNDLYYGVTDALEAEYTGFQASGGYHLVKLTVDLAPQEAALAFAAAQVEGPVARTQCTRAAAHVLKAVPRFAHLRSSLFPDNLMRQFAALPGVTARLVYLDDDQWRAGAEEAYARDVLARMASPPAAPAA